MIKPISPVSFKSAYTVNADKNNLRSQLLHREFLTLAGYMLDNYKDCSMYTVREKESKSKNTITGHTVLLVPDEHDCDVEKYCNFYGIEFHKGKIFE